MCSKMSFISSAEVRRPPLNAVAAMERLEASNIEELALLNTIPESMGEGCSKIKYLSVAPMFAEAIERIYQEISIAKLFN